MERRGWLELLIVSLFMAMACSLPRLNVPREITMRRTVVPLETVQPLVRDAIIVTPRATFTTTPTPTLISLAAAQGTMTPTPTLTETVDSAGRDEAEATATARAATQTVAASATLAPSPTVIPSATASTTSSPTGTTSPTSTSTGTASPTSTGTTTPTGTASPSPTQTQIPPTPTPTPGSSGSPTDTPEPPLTVAFSAANYSIEEGLAISPVSISVILSTTSAQTVTVDFATSNGSAMEDGDYAPTFGTLTFSPGQTSQSFDVEVFDDLFIEGDETIILTLSNPSSNVSLGTPNPATLAILNDDSTIVNTTDDNFDGTCNATHCSLREAIDTANFNMGTIETISFNILGSGPHTITPGFALPPITDPVIIDGTTQPGADCSSWPPTLMIELDGSSAGAGANGLVFAAGNSTIRGLVINRFNDDGIELNTDSNNRIECNLIGTDVSGTLDLGNGENGVLIDNVPNNTIGGATVGARNLISGNDFRGVWILGSGASGNQVLGNFIGTDASGTQPLGNMHGNIRIVDAANNIIGGTAGTTPGGPCTGVCNLLADSKQFNGITIFNGNGNTVQGNYIGTDVTGTIDLGNFDNGMLIDNASNNTIGGTAGAARNIISGNNSHGIEIRGSGSTGNQIQGSYIGTDTTGTADLGNNGSGIRQQLGATNTTIGGTALGAGNLIAHNNDSGINISSGAATVINSTISFNTTTGNGGGIENNGATLTVDNSTISGNSAQNGGGIGNLGTLAVTDSTLNGNSATIGGGGIGNNSGGMVTVSNSTISNNSAQGGGGIGNFGTLVVTDSTLNGNSATIGGGGIGNNSGGMVTVSNSTIGSNTAPIGGGVGNNSGTLTVGNTIIANNPSGGDCGGVITSNGYNLDSDNTCNLGAAGDLPNTNPMLGPLQNYGGPTDTRELLSGSPAIDAGSCPGSTIDQRGFSRPVDQIGVPNADIGCDIGAFEVQ